MIYQRSVTIRDLEDLSPRESLAQCCRSARNAGLPLTLKVDLGVCLNQSEDLLALLGLGLVNGLVFSHTGAAPPEGYTLYQAADLVRKARAFAAVNFFGDYAFWRECILVPAVVDDTAFSLHPTAPSKARRRNCLGAVGCHVLEDGSAWLCERLEGLPAANLGSIYQSEPFDPMATPVTPYLREWVLNGPECTRTLTPLERAEDAMCRRHSEQLLAPTWGQAPQR